MKRAVLAAVAAVAAVGPALLVATAASAHDSYYRPHHQPHYQQPHYVQPRYYQPEYRYRPQYVAPRDYRSEPAEPSARPPAIAAPTPVVTLPAIAIAWNSDGAWIVRSGVTLAAARDAALSACNEQYGNCELSTVKVQPATPFCLALARSDENPSKLSAASRATQEEANNGAIESCSTTNGGTCKIEYSSCNTAANS